MRRSDLALQGAAEGRWWMYRRWVVEWFLATVGRFGPSVAVSCYAPARASVRAGINKSHATRLSNFVEDTTMDPAVIAAMISAGTKVGMSLFDRWAGRTDDQKARVFVEKHFDAFRKLTSDNCMRLLKHMEEGQNRTVAELIVHLYPEFKKFPVEEQERLRSEFEYRLFFMSLAGLITRPTRVFYITEAGKAFVNEARKRREYSKVLSD